jgi:hypothetical protein
MDAKQPDPACRPGVNETTQLLLAAQTGSGDAPNRLLPQVYTVSALDAVNGRAVLGMA